MTEYAMEEILLDAEVMEPPEPLQKATLILQQLKPGQYLRMLHRRLPYPLFETCPQLAISYRHIAGQNSQQIILFWRSDDLATADFCAQIRQ